MVESFLLLTNEWQQVVFWSEKYAKRAKAEREAALTKAECSLIQQNYYLFDYCDEVLKDIGRVTDIDFGKRIRPLGEIKKILAKTKK